VRATEKILVPELGARLGNFNVIDYAPDESWLITAEWMQPLGCEKYGSDNSLWLARVKFKVGKPTRGALCLTFDDRNFAGWQRARPVFKKHGAHATFFVCGSIDAPALAAMRTLRADGHSLGLHGQTHTRATDLFKRLGEAGYFATEVAPQLDAAHAHGIEVRNWGYPMSTRNEQTDAALRRHFTRMRTGCCWRKGDLSADPMKKHDELFVPAAEVSARELLYGTSVPSCAEGWLADVSGALERARERDEVLVLYAHDITSDDAKKDPHNITRGQLEEILSRAAALDIPVIGFDELDSIRK
jgi:peptidoglycan/xylan/chitin deacetylase (PgdA/CDA1 family)